LLDVSYGRDKPDSVVVYADGPDARIFRKLVRSLGSEERAQNALILTGAIYKLERKGGATSIIRAKRVKDGFRDLVGVTYLEYLKLVDELCA